VHLSTRSWLTVVPGIMSPRDCRDLLRAYVRCSQWSANPSFVWRPTPVPRRIAVGSRFARWEVLSPCICHYPFDKRVAAPFAMPSHTRTLVDLVMRNLRGRCPAAVVWPSPPNGASVNLYMDTQSGCGSHRDRDFMDETPDGGSDIAIVSLGHDREFVITNLQHEVLNNGLRTVCFECRGWGGSSSSPSPCRTGRSSSCTGISNTSSSTVSPSSARLARRHADPSDRVSAWRCVGSTTTSCTALSTRADSSGMHLLLSLHKLQA